MYKATIEEKIERAAEQLLTTTMSVQQISVESGCSFERVAKLAKEFLVLEPGILNHRKVYNPIELNTKVGPGPALNMKAWRKEVNSQDKSRYHARISSKRDGNTAKAKTRSGGSTSDMLAKYQQRSS